MAWEDTTPEQAKAIVRVAIENYGIDSVYADIGTGQGYVITKALLEAGVEGIIACDIGDLPPPPEGIKVYPNFDATKDKFTEDVDVVLIPGAIENLADAIMAIQKPELGGMVYRAGPKQDETFLLD